MTPRQARIATDVFTGAVIVAVAAALAGLTWRLMGDPGTAPAEMGMAAAPTAASTDISQLLAAAPFGKASGGYAPATSLALQLRGIMFTHPSAASSALISSAGAPPRAYRTGEALPAGGVIEEIAIDHVLLRVNGRLEMLAFPRATADAPGAPPSSAMPSAMPDSSAPPPPGPSDYGPPPLSAQSMIDNLGATASPSGYVVGPSPSMTVRRFGFQPGDVIEKINGAQVGDAGRDQKLLSSGMPAGGTRVDVIRDGKRLTITIPLR